MFKSERVHRSDVQIFGRVLRTNVYIYILEYSTGRRCNTLSSVDVRADVMYATYFSKPVQLENWEIFYQGVPERWQVLPG